MLIDDRSIGKYPKGIFGLRIIEAKCKKPKFYDASKSEINLITPIKGNEYTLILRFEDKSLFKEMKDKVFPDREHIIVVAGEWESIGTYNVFQTVFSSKKQLKIIK